MNITSMILLVIFLVIAWILGSIRIFLWIDNFFSSYVSKCLMFTIAWILFPYSGILSSIPMIIGIIEIFRQWIRYSARKQQGQDESNISLWAEARANDRIKLIYPYVIFSSLIMFQVAGLINAETHSKYGFEIIGNMPFSAIATTGTIIYLILIAPPTAIRFLVLQRKLRYGIEISFYLAISLFISLLGIFLAIRYLLPTFGLLATLSVYCILSYKSTEYSEEWCSYSVNPILFILIALTLMTLISRVVTNYERWYIPVLEAIFACCVLTRHKDKTAPAQPQQPREPSRNSNTGEQTTHTRQPSEPPRNEPRQELRQSSTPLHDKADTLIDIGLACIGRITARDNPYITPEQTQSRHNAERPFLSILSERYTDKDTRKALARYFMLYKEFTLFVIFAMVLENYKPLHTKIRSRLKIRLSQGLPSNVIAKRNEYWRKLSEKFHESYTRTHDLAGTLDYVFWSVLPEKLKGESFADLVGNGCLMQIFNYTRNAVAQKYNNLTKEN